MQEETLAWMAHLCMFAGRVISASYDRFFDGACVPVPELGPKILG